MGLHLENEVARRVASDHHRSYAAILVNCAPSGEMHNYCTPHITKENSENFLINRCNYILISQVYCVRQFVKTQTIIFNNAVYYMLHFDIDMFVISSVIMISKNIQLTSCNNCDLLS